MSRSILIDYRYDRLAEHVKQNSSVAAGHLPSQAKPLAEAIRYLLGRWEQISRFLADGRVDLDNNPVERAIRPIALSRKNALFAGSYGGADRSEIVASLVETCKLNEVEPYAWLRDALVAMINGHAARDFVPSCLSC